MHFPLTPARQKLFYQMVQEGGDMPQLSGAAMVTLVLTFIVGFIFLALLQYTVKLLLVLVAVEEPSALYLPLDNDEAASRTATDQRTFTTSSVRGTLRHLRSEAGFWSPWRGFLPNFFFLLTSVLLSSIFTAILTAVLFPLLDSSETGEGGIILSVQVAKFLGGALSMVALARFSMVCTHIMIAAPSEEGWWTILSKSKWSKAKRTIPAIWIWVTVDLVLRLSLFAFDVSVAPTLEGRPGAIFAFVFVEYLICEIATTPAKILLIRVQASALEDDVPTIVSFDKTFRQDTSATDGVLPVHMAIKSFDKAFLRRLGIFLLKTAPVCAFAIAAFLAILVKGFLVFSVPLDKAY